MTVSSKEIILHYGTPGMKWGVRKAYKTLGKVPNNLNTKTAETLAKVGSAVQGSSGSMIRRMASKPFQDISKAKLSKTASKVDLAYYKGMRTLAKQAQRAKTVADPAREAKAIQSVTNQQKLLSARYQVATGRISAIENIKKSNDRAIQNYVFGSNKRPDYSKVEKAIDTQNVKQITNVTKGIGTVSKYGNKLGVVSNAKNKKVNNQLKNVNKVVKAYSSGKYDDIKKDLTKTLADKAFTKAAPIIKSKMPTPESIAQRQQAAMRKASEAAIKKRKKGS
jgi:hypothetical protein